MLGFCCKIRMRLYTTASLPRTIRRPQSPGQNAYSQKNSFSSSVMDSCGHQLPYSPVKAFHPHSSSCLLAGNGSVGPTIWHALLPSRHLTPLERDSSLPPKRFAMAVGLREGSWNVAWDVRPARWLHGRHSAWLLFGVCACFSAAAGASLPLVGGSVPALTEALAERQTIPPALPEDGQQGHQPGHRKKVYSDYSVIGIPGDGRCLFRAVAHGSCVSSGQQAPNETRQRELADELRNKVVDELIKRRDSTEWFIEGDFDKYVKRMRQQHVWGGEPELLMLSHVLEMPITVYMAEERSKGGGIIAIAEYGQEYSKGKKPVRVLYHGFGHYDALHLPNEQLNANL
ncbi:unnamed protein product [Sphagnum jensenii]|uniref:Ubiquitin thioesterase OTU n=1 Tax=Sphagnum jensenii TaxID=128206 RepID=A0ABP1AN38_9BRYO